MTSTETMAAGRADRTRRTLLESALQVFTEEGYAAASIADVVRRAGSSVGSLYHHFGGKVDLYLALWEDFRISQERVAALAVTELREAGETDPGRLFLGGARAYLESCWAQRDVASLFLCGDGPPGFDLLRRQNTREWLRANASLLRTEQDEPLGRALVLILTTTVGEIGREVATCEDSQAATELIEAALMVVSRLWLEPTGA